MILSVGLKIFGRSDCDFQTAANLSTSLGSSYLTVELFYLYRLTYHLTQNSLISNLYPVYLTKFLLSQLWSSYSR